MVFKKKKSPKDMSIVEYITGSINKNGILQENFELPNTDDKEGYKFAPGAMDGICMYHMGDKTLVDEDKKKLKELIILAGNGYTSKAEEGFALFCKENRVITFIDELQKSIFDCENEIKPSILFDFAVDMLLHSADVECVKIGLSILELYNTCDDEVLANTIKTVALYDEFTVFSLFIMRRWPTAEKDILDCAKKVHGWGRIHCVDFIEPSDKETIEWLLFNGIENEILQAYSAWDVFKKAEVPLLLKRGDLSYEEIHAILKITQALMDEDPIPGLSNMDNPKVFLNDVLFRAEGNYQFSEEDLKILKDIRDYNIEQ